MAGLFRGTHPKLDIASTCVAEIAKAWDEYIAARIAYAEARLGHNWTHRGGRFDENAHRASDTLSETYDDYFEKMDTFKRVHGEYKTAIRKLFQGRLL